MYPSFIEKEEIGILCDLKIQHHLHLPGIVSKTDSDGDHRQGDQERTEGGRHALVTRVIDGTDGKQEQHRPHHLKQRITCQTATHFNKPTNKPNF